MTCIGGLIQAIVLGVAILLATIFKFLTRMSATLAMIAKLLPPEAHFVIAVVLLCAWLMFWLLTQGGLL